MSSVDSPATASESGGWIAVSAEELQNWGCPYCGFRSGTSPMSGGGTTIWRCGECDRTSIALAPGVMKSTFGFGTTSIGGDTVHPELQDHPRRGIPAHGRPDVRPEAGGEFFSSRGIGLDSTPGCFVCGGPESLLNNISAFVRTKEAGERVVEMFDQVHGGARLDYRDFESDRIQVKLGACDEHLERLRVLDALCRDGRITLERIQAAAVD